MKKITVEIPEETYKIMLDYCCYSVPNRKSMFFKNLINRAILDYCRKNTVNSCSNLDYPFIVSSECDEGYRVQCINFVNNREDLLDILKCSDDNCFVYKVSSFMTVKDFKNKFFI